MKKHIFLFSGFIISVFIAACAGSDNNGGGGNPGTIISCPPGATFQNGYCVNGTSGITINTGSVGFYSENWHDRTLTPAGNGLSEFLKNAMGVCDRNHSNGGLAGCSAWAAGAFDIVMQAPNTQSNSVQVTFRAKPQMGQFANYAYSLPSAGQLAGALLGFPVVGNPGAVRNPLQLNMTVSVTNNYQGFEARGYGDFYTTANRSLIQVQIAKGKLEDPRFEYRIAYRGQIIVTGTFIRCNTADCGLAMPIGY
ncbi:MAG TPA: hypothetical protein VIG33_11170 [Pseudobdellovibrionaceae bacterium]|jgi:hypothetical protein